MRALFLCVHYYRAEFDTYLSPALGVLWHVRALLDAAPVLVAPVFALLSVSCSRVRPRVNRLLPALMKPEPNPLDAATESRHDSLTHPTLPPLEHTTF